VLILFYTAHSYVLHKQRYCRLFTVKDNKDSIIRATSKYQLHPCSANIQSVEDYVFPGVFTKAIASCGR
jgi:homospermidine synthase